MYSSVVLPVLLFLCKYWKKPFLASIRVLSCLVLELFLQPTLVEIFYQLLSYSQWFLNLSWSWYKWKFPTLPYKVTNTLKTHTITNTKRMIFIHAHLFFTHNFKFFWVKHTHFILLFCTPFAQHIDYPIVKNSVELFLC